MLAASPLYTINDELEDSDIACPTLYMAHKWLREKKGIFIMMDMWKGGYHAVLWRMDETYIKTMAFKGPNEGVWNTYEEALQAGILEALKLI